MSYPLIMLGGIPIAPESGAPEQAAEPLLGRARVRMSNGAGVQMSHWRKASGSISGVGLLPAGLDGLDYTQALELRLTQPLSKAGLGVVFEMEAACRPDREPWAYALLEDRWMRTPCTRVDQQVTVTEVAGAALYRLEWMPMYQVFADPPPASMSTGHSWTMNWEEV